MVEINSETDFVGRSEEFGGLVERVVGSVLVVGEDIVTSNNGGIVDIPIEAVLESPLLPSPTSSTPPSEPHPQTIKESLITTIGKLGENLRLRRAITTTLSSNTATVFTSGYVHSTSQTPNLGRIGALVTLQLTPPHPYPPSSLQTLAKRLAQHIAGFNPLVVSANEPLPPASEGESPEEHLSKVVLMKQQFLFGGGTVEEVLEKAGREVGEGYKVEVKEFRRWELGEGIEKKEDNFAEEVKRQAGFA